jgi:hypothetical protein
MSSEPNTTDALVSRARLVIGITVFLGAASGPVVAQSAVKRSGALPDAVVASRPAAISGFASSAKHCVSADASNVHGLGWIDAGANYTIRFNADFDIVAAVGRMALGGGVSTTAYGLPEFSVTTGSPGTMALWVGGNGQAGCYEYQVEVRPSSTVAAAVGTTRDGQPSPTLTFDAVHRGRTIAQPQAISGFASSARHCVGSNLISNVHEIGRVEANRRVTITFDSDFNPYAGAGLLNVGERRAVYYQDDNSGGDLQPQLSFTPSFGGTLALFVAGNQSAGCYRYKVDIQ